MKKPLRFALAGTGFWSRFQLHGWRELPGCECVALYNRTRSRAEDLGQDFGITAIYDDYEEMLEKEGLDFVDIVTGAEQHSEMARLAAERGLPVICQKPLSTDYASAAAMADYAAARGTRLLVNENWRWQSQIRALAAAIQQAPLGRIWRAHIDYANSFPVFENQPFLREAERFILNDIGTHMLDVMRFLFGEAISVYAHTHQVNPGIKGEDAATALFKMQNGMTVDVNLSYTSRVPGERFPEVYILVEGEDSSVSLGPDFEVRVITRDGANKTRHAPVAYPWADPRYGVVHASIVDAQRNLLEDLQGTAPAETTAEDNLRTLALVEACYRSAQEDRKISFSS